MLMLFTLFDTIFWFNTFEMKEKCHQRCWYCRWNPRWNGRQSDSIYTLSNQVPTKADSLGFRHRHHPFLTTSSQTPKNGGLQSAEEQNRFPRNKTRQKPKIADRLKRICRLKLLSSWSPVSATAPSKTRWTIHCGLQQDLPEGGTRSPPTTDPPAAKEFQHRQWDHFQSQTTAEPNVSRSDKERESRKENTVSNKQITDQNEPQPEKTRGKP